MMDECEMALLDEASYLAVMLKDISRKVDPTQKAASECTDCESPIPERRRLAMPGCSRCITCQTEVERGW